MNRVKILVNTRFVPVLVILLCVFITYFNSLTGSFHYDDNHHIERNFNIRKLGNIPSFYTSTRTFSANSEDGMYRPFLMTTFAVNYFFSGNDTTGFHVVNVALHALNSILLFLILSFIFKPDRLFSFIASLVYSVHPVNTEAVNYLSSRSDVMSTTFILIAFYFFIMNRLFLLVLVSYCLGLLTKEVAATLPLLVLSYDIILGVDINRNSSLVRSLVVKWVKKHLPVWLVTWLFLIVRKKVFAISAAGVFVPVSTIVVTPEVSEISRTLLYRMTQVKVVLNYIKLWFFPVNLTIEHDYPLVTSPVEPSLLLAILLFSVLIFLAVKSYRKDRRITFFFLWFIVSLLPTSLIPLNVAMAEKRLYLAGVGVAGMLTGCLLFLYNQNVLRERGKRALFIASIIIISVLSFTAISRNRVWQSEMSLWTDAFNKRPLAPVTSQILAEAYLKEGKPDRAIELFEKSISLAPSGSRYNSLGMALYQKRRIDEAAMCFERAIVLEPKKSGYYINLANIFYGKKEYIKAVKLYKQAIKVRPESSYAYSNLGNTYSAMGKYDKALSSYEKAVEIDPANYKAIRNIKRVTGAGRVR